MTGYKICHTDEDFSKALQLTKKYFEWLHIDIGDKEISQGFNDFVKNYKNPDGGFIVALNKNEEIIGGVGIREISDDTCEMKRLFVLPEYFGKGIGENLCRKIILLAEELGYKKIRLDTFMHLAAANNLFRKIGFVETEPFRNNSKNDLLFLELTINN